jgi:hypothetical protein
MQTYNYNYFNLAKTSLKVFKVSCCRLKSLYLEALACLEVDRLVMSGQPCGA